MNRITHTTTVTYIGQLDLIDTYANLNPKDLDIKNIDRRHVKDKNMLRDASVLILKHNGKYQVLKSRF